MNPRNALIAKTDCPRTGSELTLKNRILSAQSGLTRQQGKIGWAILWLLGVPLPVLLILYLIFRH